MIPRLRLSTRSFSTRSTLHALSRRPPRLAIPTISNNSTKYLRAQERKNAIIVIPPTASEEIEGIAINDIQVSVPIDKHGVLDQASDAHAAIELLSCAALIVQRKIEMMNLFLGFEQATQYEILAPDGSLRGYLMEEDLGLKASLVRNLLKTHRAFKATVLDTAGTTLLIIRRPFSLISSRITISIPGPDGLEASEVVIGEAAQEWHIYRRKMNFFVKRDGGMEQFGYTDAGFLAWDFPVKREDGQQVASINRNFSGFAREIFTDTGAYAIRFEGVAQELAAIEGDTSPLLANSSSGSTELIENKPILDLARIPSITLDQRAVLLSAAVSLDVDYFTRSRGGLMGGGMPMFIPIPSGGGSGEPPVVGAEGGEGPTSDGPLPSTEQSGDYDLGGNNSESGNYPSDTPASDWNAGEETMDDPWASAPEASEGGSWSWTDLFPEE